MKRHAHQSFPVLATSLGLLLLGAHADSTAGSTLVPQGAPKSEFIDKVEFGKDPFFPTSVRRPKVLVHIPDSVPSHSMVPEWVVLKGITSFQGRKLAIINNYTVGEGEEFLLKTRGEPIRIKCVEIKDKSAIVSVHGATKEIPLRPGL